MANQVKNVLIVGTGGQGVILASDILSDVLADVDGIEVKKNETHGMSQRGGSVHSQVRFGPKVNTPFISPGEADIILAFEEAEGLRWSHYLAKEGVMILNTENIVPPLAYVGLAQYPYAEIGELKKDPRVKAVDASQLALEAGNTKVVSVVLLGALAALLGFDEGIWLTNLEKRVPQKALKANLAGFAKGMSVM